MLCFSFLLCSSSCLDSYLSFGIFSSFPLNYQVALFLSDFMVKNARLVGVVLDSNLPRIHSGFLFSSYQNNVFCLFLGVVWLCWISSFVLQWSPYFKRFIYTVLETVQLIQSFSYFSSSASWFLMLFWEWSQRGSCDLNFRSCCKTVDRQNACIVPQISQFSNYLHKWCIKENFHIFFVKT